jgi:hypothetical protein
MVKCPNCQTFNTELVDYVDDFCGSIAVHYECVCGAKFHINHYANNDICIDEMPETDEEGEKTND